MSRIFVEVGEMEASLLAAAMRAITEGTMRAIAPDLPQVNNQRLADRFELAATNNDEPVHFMGEAVFIQREMT